MSKLEDESRCGLNCCRANRSSAFDIVGRFEIGLWLASTVRSRPGFFSNGRT